MSNADISAALVLSLWIDLASSGKILNLGFVLIIGTLVCILFKCGKESFFCGNIRIPGVTIILLDRTVAMVCQSR